MVAFGTKISNRRFIQLRGWLATVQVLLAGSMRAVVIKICFALVEAWRGVDGVFCFI